MAVQDGQAHKFARKAEVLEVVRIDVRVADDQYYATLSAMGQNSGVVLRHTQSNGTGQRGGAALVDGQWGCCANEMKDDSHTCLGRTVHHLMSTETIRSQD